MALQPERRKTGRRDPHPFVIHLHPHAVALLRSQPVLQGSDFVFWGRRDRRPFDFQHSQLDRLRAAVAVKDWRLHDLRRYTRSGMASIGIAQTVAEFCLGHLLTGLPGVYDRHDYSNEKRDAWARWGDRLVALTR